MPDRPHHRITRRALLRTAAMGAGAAVLPAELLRPLRGTAAAGSSLSDIDHVVVVMQENRSFDHYLGTLRGVRGYADGARTALPDGHSVLSQPDALAPGGRALPFRLGAECSTDLSHDWGPQHQAWNHGRMDNWLPAHRAADGAAGPQTMGYYTRADLPYWYALADGFTVCDSYFCSVMSPTNPNRVMSMSGTIDPAGLRGGPCIDNGSTGFTWTTYPERLQAAGVSWRIYHDADDDTNNVVELFPAFQDQTSPLYQNSALHSQAEFLADAASGGLPQVSWILATTAQCEHPPAPGAAGEDWFATLLRALTANTAAWARTAVFLMYDENDGFFDHVTPPTAPPRTSGEYLTVSPLPAGAAGIAGPIGLGFRVPMMVVSPFSRGGLVCSDVFDHTSTLRFLETRFGVEVPNLSAWRRATCGDLTSAFNFAAAADTTLPALPDTASRLASVLPGCATSLAGAAGVTTVPGIPAQEVGVRARPSGIVRASAAPATSSGPLPAAASSSAPNTGSAGDDLGGGAGMAAGLALGAVGALLALRRRASAAPLGAAPSRRSPVLSTGPEANL